MNKKIFKKAGVGLLVSAVAIGGAFAWLTNTDTAVKQNNIVAGTIRVFFDNQTDTITLTDNDAIPMTSTYALQNLTPYSFDISSEGNIITKYTIKAVVDNADISTDLIKLSLDAKLEVKEEWMGMGMFDTEEAANNDMANQVANKPTREFRVFHITNNNYGPSNNGKYMVQWKGYLEPHMEYGTFDNVDNANAKAQELRESTGEEYRTSSNDGVTYYIVKEIEGTRTEETGNSISLTDATTALISDVALHGGNSHDYKLHVRIDESATNEQILAAKNLSFHLEVDAIQDNDAVDLQMPYYIDTVGNVIPNANFLRIPAENRADKKVYTGDVYKIEAEGAVEYASYEATTMLKLEFERTTGIYLKYEPEVGSVHPMFGELLSKTEIPATATKVQ